jgi:dynein heavy chain
MHITWATLLIVLPEQALVSVAARFLVDIPGLPDDMRENIAYHMAFAHKSLDEASQR